MLRKTLPLLALSIAGCASMPGTQDVGTGRFLQMTANGYLMFQMDSNSPVICAQTVRAMDKKQGLEMVCATESKHQKLPFYFVMTNVATSEQTTGRAQTNEACELFVSESKKDPANRMFKYSECELSRKN
jgi:hypothetical protein